MQNKPKVDSYDPIIYPRMFWVAHSVEGLNKIFVFCKCNNSNEEDLNAYDNLADEVKNGTGVLVTCPVIHRSSRRCGVMVIVLKHNDIIAGDEAHEAVHVADYMFEQLGMCSQTFSDNNEQYAYLVGWAAGCISKSLINIRKEYDTRREFENMEA